jgi:hypothetical protein
MSISFPSKDKYAPERVCLTSPNYVQNENKFVSIQNLSLIRAQALFWYYDFLSNDKVSNDKMSNDKMSNNKMLNGKMSKNVDLGICVCRINI